MASLSTDKKNGHRTIQFMGGDGKRYSIRLGKVPKKMAEGVRLRVEFLVAHKITGQPLDEATHHWVTNLSDVLHQRLSKVGLVNVRPITTLGDWIKTYIKSRKSELKPSSIESLEITAQKLKDYFGETTRLDQIEPEHASAFEVYLRDIGLAEPTIRHHNGNVKTIFNAALKQKLITTSPFAELSSTSLAGPPSHYVTPEDADLVLSACPTLEWQVLFGLARLAGLRTPSETHGLKWSMIDWQESKMTVPSVKTEHHPGHAQRTTPITLKLMKILVAHYHATTPKPDDPLVRIKPGRYMRTQMRKIIDKAGLEQWPKVFQALRQSCDIEWSMIYPEFAVDLWLGHSKRISRKHYKNIVPDQLHEQITGVRTTESVVHNPVQQVAILNRRKLQK